MKKLMLTLAIAAALLVAGSASAHPNGYGGNSYNGYRGGYSQQGYHGAGYYSPGYPGQYYGHHHHHHVPVVVPYPVCSPYPVYPAASYPYGYGVSSGAYIGVQQPGLSFQLNVGR